MNVNPNQQAGPDIAEDYITPPVNIYETSDAIFIEAEMPGVDKDHLEISIEGNDLIIVGRRLPKKETGDPVSVEIPKWNFRRAFTLGDYVNRSDIHASFEAGILTLRLGKAEDVKPRKIEVEFK